MPNNLLTVNVTVVNPLEDAQAFTLQPEENADLWNAMKGFQVGTRKKLTSAMRIVVKPIDQRVAGYDLSTAHEYLTTAFKDVPWIEVERDKMVLIVRDALREHAGFRSLVGPEKEEAPATTGDTMIGSGGDTTPIPTAPGAKPAKHDFQAELRARREQETRGDTSSDTARKMLKNKFNVK